LTECWLRAISVPSQDLLSAALSTLSDQLCGTAASLFVVAGHAYYFLEDVYPRMTGRRPLKTPGFIQAMFPVDEPIRPAADVVMQHFAADELQQQQQQVANGVEQQGQEQVQQQAAPAAAVEAGGDGRPHAD
jgi:hypothetical protein